MKLHKTIIGTAILTGILSISGFGNAAEQDKSAAAPAKGKIKPYTLKTCPVTDEKLGEMGDPYVHQYKGKEVKFCCEGCLKDFNAAPAKFIKKIEAAELKAAGLKPYTLDTCAVSDEKLGEMGEPYALMHKGRQIKLCCEGCLKDFNSEPAKYIKKIEAAEKQAKAKK